MGLLKFYDRFPHKTQTGGGLTIEYIIDEVTVDVEDDDEVIIYVEDDEVIIYVEDD